MDNDKFWADPWKVLAEPFVQAYQAEKEAQKQGVSRATQQRLDRDLTTRTLINKSRHLEVLRRQAGQCKVDLIDQKFVGTARELAHKGDAVRRLAQLPRGALTPA
jgi:hypothetical protein